MRPFIKRAALFIAIQLVIVLAVAGLARPNTKGWLSAGIDKRMRLQTAPGPRIVFIGGSSVCFGIDSTLVQSELGLNPVNMGLHAALGMDFILEEAKTGLRSNDVLVVSFEYEEFVSDQTQWPLLAEIAITDPWLVARAKPVGLLDGGYREIIWKWIDSSAVFGRVDQDQKYYNRDAFNTFGDVVHWQGTILKPGDQAATPAAEAPPPYLDKSMDKLLRFQERCQRKGVTVYWVYPPIADYAFKPELAGQIRDELTRRVPMIQLNQPEDSVYPARLFWDTIYHLTHEGAVLRTQQIIKRLQLLPAATRAAEAPGTNIQAPNKLPTPSTNS
jgi:hypothetical protein